MPSNKLTNRFSANYGGRIEIYKYIGYIEYIEYIKLCLFYLL